MKSGTLKWLVILAVGLFPLTVYAIAFPDIPQVLQNLNVQLNWVWRALIAASYVIGIWLVGMGFLKLNQYGKVTVFMMAQVHFSGPLMMIVVGSVLVALPATMDSVLMTIWAQGGRDSIMSWPGLSSAAWWQTAGLVVPMIQVIGLLSFIRGWMQLAKAGGQGNQPGTVSKGVLHVLGGILAINFVGTVETLRATLGFT